eukprot:1160695-Pelagomonas_calceolata.AAC.10
MVQRAQLLARTILPLSLQVVTTGYCLFPNTITPKSGSRLRLPGCQKDKPERPGSIIPINEPISKHPSKNMPFSRGVLEGWSKISGSNPSAVLLCTADM